MTSDTNQETAPQWVQRDDENVRHMGLIGVGGFGEIHKVSPSRINSCKMQNLDDYQVSLESFMLTETLVLCKETHKAICGKDQ
jgi:hypothetical protein